MLFKSFARLLMVLQVVFFVGGSHQTFAADPDICTAALTDPSFVLKKKVIILSSTFGMGHQSTSEGVEKAIKTKYPDAEVKIVNVEALRNPIYNFLETKFFWWMVKNHPRLYDWGFKFAMDRGLNADGLSGAMRHVSARRLRKFLELEDPTLIVTTHHLSTPQLAEALQSAELTRLRKTIFFHTDYFSGYFPRVVEKFDLSVLPHPDLIAEWRGEGAPSERMVATGLPINPEVFRPIDRAEFLRSKNLDPSVFTVTLASGGEGVGDYPTIVKSLAASAAGRPIQIVAICAKNKLHFENLTKLKLELAGTNVSLTVLGFTKQPEMFGFIKSSNVYITKSGGLSPSEGFAMNKPMILLDVYGGHERENAVFFERQGLALINRDQATIGAQVQHLISNQRLLASMSQAQHDFTELLDMSKIMKVVDQALGEPNQSKGQGPQGQRASDGSGAELSL